MGLSTISQGRIAQIKVQSSPQMFPAIHLAIKSTFIRSADEISTIITPESANEKPMPVNINLIG